jgi:hypothetical protein
VVAFSLGLELPPVVVNPNKPDKDLITMSQNSIVTQLLNSSGKSEDAGIFSPQDFGADKFGLVPLQIDGVSQISGSIDSPTISDKLAIDAENKLIPQETELTKEAEQMLSLVDPDNPNQYLHLRYYGQTGMKRGFTYMYTTQNGTVASVKFTNGVFVTKDIWLIGKLDADIARTRGGIGTQIKNVTEAYYNEMAGKATMYRNMIVGTANSSMGDSHKYANLEANRKLTESLVTMQDRIRELEGEVIAARGGTTTLKDPGTSSFFNKA